MVRVKVLKLAGETGLRLPGSCYPLDEVTAAFLSGKGLVEIQKVPKAPKALKVVKAQKAPKVKEEKAKIETKEEKFKPKTKKKKS
jgi:hypothetical protein